MFGKSSRNQPALTTYRAAQPPRPRRDLVYQVFLIPTHRLIVFNNACVQLGIFCLAQEGYRFWTDDRPYQQHRMGHTEVGFWRDQ